MAINTLVELLLGAGSNFISDLKGLIFVVTFPEKKVSMVGFVVVTQLLYHKVLHSEAEDWRSGTRNLNQSPGFHSSRQAEEFSPSK